VHDPTQGMRQGNDVGTQYRSAIYTLSEEQAQVAKELKEAYEPELLKRGYGPITTEIKPAPTYYYAEDYHQQYLAKNPHGYRCHSATGVPWFGGSVIASTTEAWCVLETSHPPAYYLPRSAFVDRDAAAGRRVVLLRMEGTSRLLRRGRR
jgi:hypothetical protein